MANMVVQRIEITPSLADSRAVVLRDKLARLSPGLTSVQIVDVYSIAKRFSGEQLNQIAAMLSNPITDRSGFNSASDTLYQLRLDSNFAWAVEIGFLPGVTDNAGRTAAESIEDLLKVRFSGEEDVFTSRLLLLAGELSEAEVRELAQSLSNGLIQRVQIKPVAQFKADGGMGLYVPVVVLKQNPGISEVDLAVDDDELIAIGKSGIADAEGRRGPLALDLESMKVVQDYFKQLGRPATDLELESIAQTWSEHCKHTIFANPIDDEPRGIYKAFIKAATEEVRKRKGANDLCVSVFTDNSGAFKFDDEYLVTHKVETHNSPSALDPFGGAITGIVGVNRDTIGTGMGAKPVLNTYGFCFADPDDEVPLYRDADRASAMLAPRRIMNGVIDGVNSGGNQSGIPTPQGFMYFDDSYKGKPLVFVGTVGLIPQTVNDRPSTEKKANPGDLIVVVGGRVGLDGIHGATFSSVELDSSSPATAVQIGDPITQKKLSDAIVKEARDLDLYSSITDNGAGGLSCSVAEMAKESGGFEVQLEKVPLKYPGLAPWQIWISESQERMTLSVPPAKWDEFNELMQRRGVEATVIGKFTDSGQCLVTYNDQLAMDIEMDFLHDGLPKRAQQTEPFTVRDETSQPEPVADHNQFLARLMARPNVASFAFVSSQYDHEVQASSVLKPLQGRGRVNADATAIRPVLTSTRGVGVSQALFPTYSEIDSYRMAAITIDAAIRNLVAIGVDPATIALLDNFCWCSSNDPVRLAQLKAAAEACYDYSVAYEAPFISGKDSMFNDFRGYDQTGQPVTISVLPTLLISSIGLIPDIASSVSLDAKLPGDIVYVIGADNSEIGGSEYLSARSQSDDVNYFSKSVAEVDAAKLLALYRSVHQAIKQGLVASAVSVGRGGLAVALARKAMAGRVGLDVQLDDTSDSALYGEGPGRLVVTVDPAKQAAFERVLDGQTVTKIGTVTADGNLVIDDVINLKTGDLLDAYRSTFAGY